MPRKPGAATSDDGFFVTGDLAMLDERG